MIEELNEMNSHVKLSTTRKNGKYINRNVMYRKLEKMKNNAINAMPQIKKQILIDKIFNKDILYKRSYKLFSQCELKKTLFDPVILLPKLRIPNLNKNLICPMDEIQYDKIENEKKKQISVPSKKINNSNIYQIQNMRIKNKNNKKKVITFEDSLLNYKNFSYHKLDLTKEY